MTEKRKTPWKLFFLLLLFVEVLAYYMGGLFLFEDLSLSNYEEKISFIFLHPFQNWFNERTPLTMGIGLILWLMAVSYFITYYRNYHFDKEHGVAEWEDVKRADKKLRDPDEDRNTYLSENIAIGFDALSNMNLLVIGGSGSYKTTSVLTPNLLRANCSNIVLDIKGDLLKKHGRYLKEHGVTVKALNFKSPLESDRYNPFLYIQNDSDLIGLITNIQQSVKPPDAMQGEPFWEDGVGLYLQSMFEHEWLTSKEQGRRPTMNNILKLVNMEARKVDEEGTTELQQEMDSLATIYGDDYPPVRDYRKLKEGATETVRSIIIMVNAQLRLFELPEVKRIFEDDDIDIPSLGLGVDGDPEKKTALFLVMRSGDTSYNLFINLFYTQLFRVLRDVADNQCKGGKLPIHVRLWADEYYAGPKPADAEMLLGEIRSRNISMVPILQDIAQLKTLYPQEKWEIFTSNCAATIYLGSGPTAHSTHQWISDMLEDMTIDTRSESLGQGMNSNSNLQMSKAGIKLMTPGQVREMPKKDCILFLEGLKPIYDKKALPFHTQPWLESEKLAGEYGYTNPVRVIYNQKNRTYKTIRSEEKIKPLTKREFEYFKEAEKTDKSIKTFEVDADEFLYLNWHERPRPTEEELAAMVRDMAKRDVSKLEPPSDVRIEQEKSIQQNGGENGKKKNRDAVLKFSTKEKWDLSGNILDCLLRYSDQLSEDELEEIIGGIEDGLSDQQIKEYFALQDAGKMNQYRRMFRGMNRKQN